MRKMSKRGIIAIVVIAALLVLVVANRIWQRARRPVTKSITELQSERGIPVAVDTVGLGDISESIELIGTVHGIVQSDLVSKITERVVRVSASAGERVKEGQVLVVFDTSNPMAQYRQAKAALENAEKDYARMKALLEQGAISEQMFERTESGLEVAQANFEAARSMVEIVSPIEGVVTTVNAHEGETVPAGNVVCTVARVDRIKVVVKASETEIQKLSVGALAAINAKEASNAETNNTARSGQVIGHVSTISSSADPETRTFRVEVVADNTAGALRPGSFVTVAVQTANMDNVLTVPSFSIVTREGKQGVFVARDDGTAEFRHVKAGVVNSRATEVRDGLTEGERIVIRGYELLRGGETLNIIESEQEGQSAQ